MNNPDEESQVEQVIDRLAARYDALSREDVTRAVAEVRGRLADARIRDFIPVLIENEARDILIRQLQQTEFHRHDDTAPE